MAEKAFTPFVVDHGLISSFARSNAGDAGTSNNKQIYSPSAISPISLMSGTSGRDVPAIPHSNAFLSIETVTATATFQASSAIAGTSTMIRFGEQLAIFSRLALAHRCCLSCMHIVYLRRDWIGRSRPDKR